MSFNSFIYFIDSTETESEHSANTNNKLTRMMKMFIERLKSGGRGENEEGFRLTTEKTILAKAIERTNVNLKREFKSQELNRLGLPLLSITFARAKLSNEFAQLSLLRTRASTKTIDSNNNNNNNNNNNEKKKKDEVKIPFMRMLKNNPDGLVISVMGKTAAVFLAGGLAGALAKTCTAPLDRLKIIMQTAGANKQQSAAAKAAVDGGLIPAFIAIGKSEGIAGYWRGNTPQVARVLPYSATMLFAYDFYKKKYTNKETGELSVAGRLAAGASAACTATIITYPLDIIRLRLSIDPTTKNMVQVFKNILKEEGAMAFAKGLPATCLSIAPYSALNFCMFDLIKASLPAEIRNEPQGIAMASLMATALATGSCYPLDTVRRQMQMKSSTTTNIIVAAKNIVATQGVAGLFRGFVPNAVKNMPNKSIQLTTYDVLKKYIAKSELAYEKEKAVYLKELKNVKVIKRA